MGMYALIEDARMAALDAANRWNETEPARELLAKIDALETLSDRWYGECPQAARGFTEAAQEADDALATMRSEAVIDAAEALCGHAGPSDAYDDAWEEADNEAPAVEQVIQSARLTHAGDDYLRRFGS
jgi:hypothetical protein